MKLAIGLNAKTLLKILLQLAACSTLLVSCHKNIKLDQNTFTINLPREIHSVDPLLLRGTAKRYALFNLHRGLFYYDKNNKLTAHGAKNCKWINKLQLNCSLSKKKWSDGSPVLAKHYLYSYLQIKKLKDESLESVKNISEVTALNDSLLSFKFVKPVQDVKHGLTSLHLSPRNKNQLFKKPNEQLFSGPYTLNQLNKKYIFFKSNPYFDSFKRPNVKGVFVDDPSAALNMFESGQLNFLRYLETSNVPSYPNVLQVPFAKLNGLFLNRDKLSIEARKALILSLDFKELGKLYSGPGNPGCLELPNSFFDKKLDCFEFNLEKAKAFLTQTELKKIKLKIYIPKSDTNEYKKLAQWVRAQWLKNLSLDVQIEIVEPKMFYSNLKNPNYFIYRKAQPLNDLGCFNAIEGLKRTAELKHLKNLDSKTCRPFFEQALASYSWIPLGLPYYAHLPSKKFSGYYINLLGQFGLERLTKIN